MDRAQEIRQKIDEATHAIDKLRDRRYELQREYANVAAKRKVGDQFTQDGYPYHGKLCEIVSFCCVLDFASVPRIEYTAAPIIKGGHLSKSTFTVME